MENKKKILPKNRTFSERERINYISRGEQRLSYINHKYENEYRMDGLLSLIATWALSVSVKIFLDDLLRNNLHFDWFLFLWTICFSFNLVISLYLFYLGSKAFKFEIDRLDRIDKVQDSSNKKEKEEEILAEINSSSVSIGVWTKRNLIILSLGLFLGLIFLFLNSDLYDKALQVFTCSSSS